MSSRAARDPALFDDAARNYDAVLIVSFGGPEGPQDVLPFLDNVLRGLPVSDATKARIAKRYERFGGVSPINDHVRAFIAALRKTLDKNGPALPVYWGNRNWHPLLSDTLAQMEADGVERAVAYVTSVFSSYSGCRKYREDLYEAAAKLKRPPIVDKLRMGFNHGGYIEAASERVGETLSRVPAERHDQTPILFTAHSLPESMARHATYETQLGECCRLIGDALEHPRWQLVYQSNNASYGGERWLGPDVRAAIESLAAEGAEDVVVAPIGFVCDHLEVVLDLDVEAAETARRVGINMLRAPTVGTHPAYVEMVRDLIVERMTARAKRHALGTLGPSHDICPADCCLSGRPGPSKPALCGADSPVLPGERTP
jgi:ferrochelatase